jgi:shikimate kinase
MAILKVFLIGYMGSGKSTIAKALSEITRIPAFDLDQAIENRAGKSISEIFNEKGELQFRLLEHTVLKEMIDKPEAMILSWGGGTPCYANNHEFLSAENTKSIYLSASISTLFDRLKNQKEFRPLLANKTEDELKEYIAKNLFDRSYFYNQANFKINCDNKSIQEIVEEILKILT